MKQCLLLVLGAFCLAGCQSTASKAQQLAQICADPGNRAPGSFYFAECQSLYPLSPQTRERDYFQTAPE